MEIHREEIKRTSKEAMDKWNKAGFSKRNWGYQIGKKKYKIEKSGRRWRQKLLKSCDAKGERAAGVLVV